MMLSMSAPKRSKCPCEKRATATLMSDDGKRELLPVCAKCGIIVLHVNGIRERDELAQRSPTTDFKELRDWLARSGGVSSFTLVSVLVPELREFALGACRSSPDAPHDPEDFVRCRKALAFIPNGVARMPEVAAVHPVWKELAANWPELERLYQEEIPTGRGNAPKLYARMQELRGVKRG